MPNVNPIDLVVLGILLLYGLNGIRRGFLLGLAELAAFGLAMVLALKTYPLGSQLLVQQLGAPRGLANLAALLVLFLAAQALLAMIMTPLLAVAQRPILLIPPLRLMNALAGLTPGLVKGVIIASLMVSLASLVPINGSLNELVERSTVASRLSNATMMAVPRLEALLGAAVDDTAVFLAKPRPPEKVDLRFPKDLALAVDAASEVRMLELVNAERARHNLRPLRPDDRLRAVARLHSDEMFRLSYFAHASPVNGSPGDRARAAAIPYQALGENIAYAPNVDVAHTGLMESPGHRANILSPSYGRVGIGVVSGGPYGRMFTQEFAD